MIHGHAIIGPIDLRWNASRPADATEAALSVREADGCGVNVAGMMAEGMRGEHFLFDFRPYEGTEIASIRFPPQVSVVMRVSPEVM